MAHNTNSSSATAPNDLEAVSKQIMGIVQGYHPAAVLFAAADLNLFGVIGTSSRSATDLAQRLLLTDARGLTILCDALVAIKLLAKDNSTNTYSVPPAVLTCLGASGYPGSILAHVQLMANVYRTWGKIAEILTSESGKGSFDLRYNSIRGRKADEKAYIVSMNDQNLALADRVVGDLKDIKCTHVLDVGSGVGTWALAFLKRFPLATATLYDLPDVIEMARKHVDSVGMAARVKLATGDFYKDELPLNTGADVVWVSAIVHQSSRQQNLDLYAKVYRALVPGGIIAIRDFVMDEDHTAPVGGAMFAVNMLVNTPEGDCLSLSQFKEQLEASGFVNVDVARPDTTMSAIVVATKP